MHRKTHFLLATPNKLYKHTHTPHSHIVTQTQLDFLLVHTITSCVINKLLTWREGQCCAAISLSQFNSGVDIKAEATCQMSEQLISSLTNIEWNKPTFITRLVPWLNTNWHYHPSKSMQCIFLWQGAWKVIDSSQVKEVFTMKSWYNFVLPLNLHGHIADTMH